MSAFERPPCAAASVAAVPCTGAGLSASRKRLVLVTAVLGSSLAFIDSSVVGVALPVIQRELSADAASAQWIVNAYLLALGSLVLVGGAAGDRFGRRRIFLLGILVFGAASIACGASSTPTSLVIARAVQGLGAALLTPNSLALLGATFPEDERGRAFGAWAGFAAMTSALGPPLGGWLADTISWRAVFFVNVPIALLTIVLAWRVVPESRDPDAARLDALGAGLVAVALGASTWGLTAAPDRGWTDVAVVSALVAGAVLFGVFLLVESRLAHPMMPLELFRSREFAGANLLTLLLYFALGGVLFFLPFDLIGAQGYSAAAAGGALLPFSIVMGAFSSRAGRLADRIGARGLLSGGAILAAAGLAILGALPIGTPYWRGLLPALLVLASGMTLAVGPLTATVMGAVAPARVGIASGVNNAVARVAGLLAVAVLGVVVSAAFTRAAVASGVAPADARARLADVMSGRAVSDASLRAAFHHAFAVVTWVAAALAFVGGLTVLRTLPARRSFNSSSRGSSSPRRAAPN